MVTDYLCYLCVWNYTDYLCYLCVWDYALFFPNGDVCCVRAACKHLFKTRTAAIEHGVKAELPDLPINIVDTQGVKPNNRTFVVTGAAALDTLAAYAALQHPFLHPCHLACITWHAMAVSRAASRYRICAGPTGETFIELRVRTQAGRQFCTRTRPLPG